MKHRFTPIISVIAQLIFFSPIALAGTLELTLPQAERMALSANKNLIVARLSYENEQYSKEAALSEFDLKVIPTITLGKIGDNALSSGTAGANNSAGVQLRKKMETGAIISAGPSWNRSGETSNSTMNISVQQPLLRGLGTDINLDGVRQAEFSLGASRRSFDQAKINTALEIIGAYYEAIKQKQFAGLNQSLGERLRRLALIVRSKEQVGLSSSMDTYRAEIRLKDAEDSANQALNAFLNAKDRLKIILNMNLDTDIELVAPLVPTWDIDSDTLENDAVQNRIDILQLRAEVNEARRAVDVSTNALLPEANLQMNYGQATIANPSLSQYLPTTQRQWSVYLQASTDLYHTAEKTNARRARLRLDTLQLNLESKIAEVKRQIRQQRLALAEAAQRIVLRNEQIRQAEGKLALAEVKFTHDMADNFDVVEAEAELQRARTNLLATEADYAVGIYNLMAMTGHLFDAFPEEKKLSEK